MHKLRRFNCSTPSIPSISLRNGNILLRFSDKRALTEQKSSAGKSGSTFWTQNSTTIAGKNQSSRRCMKSTTR